MAKSQHKSDFHKGNCLVCKSPHRKEIEDDYFNWVSPYDLEVDYPNITSKSVYRHVRYYGLDKKRDADHDKLLGAIIDRGFQKNRQVSDGVMLKAVEMRMKKRRELGSDAPIVNIAIEQLQKDRLSNIKAGLDRFGIKTPVLEDIEIEDK